MKASEVLGILRKLQTAGIRVWLDGGWGVDALVGRETREHDDLDVVVALDDVARIIDVLGEERYDVSEDELPTRFVMKNGKESQVDLHTVTFDEEGGGVQRLQSGKSYRYPPSGFSGKGSIQGQAVDCLTAEVQAECHYGYEPDEKDIHDMRLLREHFGIVLKSPYV
jgi:lincosamide nucleotidyltransferase A/C/D/E